MKKKEIKSSLLLIVTALIWGSAFVAQSVGAEHLGPFSFMAFRSLLATLFLSVVTIRQKDKSNKNNKLLYIGGLYCGIVLFLASFTQQVGVSMTSTAKASFISSLYVLFVPIIMLCKGKKLI